MFKKLGFIVLVLGLFALLRPSLVQSVFGYQSNKTITKDSVVIEEDVYEKATQYAEGYDANSFGAAFTADSEMFPIIEDDPPTGTWTTLLKLTFEIEVNEETGDVLYQPQFTKKIEALEGQIIEVEGFIIPHDIAAKTVDINNDGQRFMFSAFPLASCFFCGGAGAESVLEVYPKEPVPYSKNKVTIRGKLRFNRTDFLQLPYQLDDAVLVEKDL